MGGTSSLKLFTLFLYMPFTNPPEFLAEACATTFGLVSGIAMGVMSSCSKTMPLALSANGIGL